MGPLHQLVFVAALASCATNVEPEFGMADWYIRNGTGSTMALNIYDKVCRQTHFRVRVPRTGEIPISTCANSEGRAELRYQRTGGFTGAQNPWLDTVMQPSQTLVVR